jgi:hypothetical protein
MGAIAEVTRGLPTRQTSEGPPRRGELRRPSAGITRKRQRGPEAVAVVALREAQQRRRARVGLLVGTGRTTKISRRMARLSSRRGDWCSSVARRVAAPAGGEPNKCRPR